MVIVILPQHARSEIKDRIRLKTDAVCQPDAQSDEIQLTLTNVISSEGNMRVSLYGPEKSLWLAKRSYILRYDVPAQEGKMVVCVPLPKGPGNYALSVYHDENADTDFQRGREGGGFSRDAKPGFLGLPPSFKKVVFATEAGRNPLTINLRYPKKRSR